MKRIKLRLIIILLFIIMISYSCVFVFFKTKHILLEEIKNSQKSLLNQDYLELNTIYVREGYGTAIYIFLENNVYFHSASYTFSPYNNIFLSDSIIKSMQYFLNPVAAEDQVDYYFLQDSLLKYEKRGGYSHNNSIYYSKIRGDTIYVYQKVDIEAIGIKHYNKKNFILYKSINADPEFIREIDSVAKIYLK